MVSFNGGVTDMTYKQLPLARGVSLLTISKSAIFSNHLGPLHRKFMDFPRYPYFIISLTFWALFQDSNPNF